MGNPVNAELNRAWVLPAGLGLSGVLALVSAVFLASRAIVTQDDLIAAQLANSNERLKIWAELNDRERNSFRQRDWVPEKKIIELQMRDLERSIENHKHRGGPNG